LNIFLAIGHIREFNLLDLLGQSFVLINALVALIVLQSNLSTLVTLNTAAAVLVALLIVVLVMTTRREESTKWTIDRSLLVLMVKYGIKSHIAILAGALIFRADLLVVNHFRGADEAGVYSVASQFAMMLMLIPSVIATLLFPRVTAEQDSSGATTCLVARATTFVMLVCCLAAIPLAFLIPLVYGRPFTDSSIQLLILLPGVFFVGIQSVVVQHFAATGFPKAVPAFWLLTLAFNIVLVFGLVPKFGARGAAAASTFSYCMIAALIITHFCRVAGRSLSDVFLVSRSELMTMLDASTSLLRASR
jgi:O-antigen/teichoic acid export membrane protein